MSKTLYEKAFYIVKTLSDCEFQAVYAGGGVQEWYDGEFELDFMKYIDSQNLRWTKKHGIIIPYVNKKGLNSFYVPDFLVEENIIVETKGFFKPHKESLKIPAALSYCENNGYSYIYIRSKKIKNKYKVTIEEKFSLIRGTNHVISTIQRYQDSIST